MDVNFTLLATDVKDAVDTYVPPERGEGLLGSPLPADWFEAGLMEMRSSLVHPFWRRMRDLDPTSGKLVVLDVVVVADDGAGSLVAFDPLTKDEFVLALRSPDPDLARAVDVVSCGMRGDAVGCFLSR